MEIWVLAQRVNLGVWAICGAVFSGCGREGVWADPHRRWSLDLRVVGLADAAGLAPANKNQEAHILSPDFDVLVQSVDTCEHPPHLQLSEWCGEAASMQTPWSPLGSERNADINGY